jgi:hypothetical protein
VKNSTLTKVQITPSMAAALVTAALSRTDKTEPRLGSADRRDFVLDGEFDAGKLPEGRIIAQLVKIGFAGEPPQCRRHPKVAFHFAIMLKGWARFICRRKQTLVEAGDCVWRQPSGFVPYLLDYSPDMEYIEIVSWADPVLRPGAHRFGGSDGEAARNRAPGLYLQQDRELRLVRVPPSDCRQIRRAPA